MPDSVTNFAFICITSFIGFIILLFVFFGELFRLDKKHIEQCIKLSIVNFLFNLFVLYGSKGPDSTTIACVLSAYFVFVPIFEYVFIKKKPRKNTICGILIVLTGLMCLMDFDVRSLLNMKILFLLFADITFALYIIFTGKYTAGSNPTILAMGQLFFNFVIAFLCWTVESIITKRPMALPSIPTFWGSVIFISFFIRGLYGIVQTYAQRFVSPFNTSLIFSTEIIITLLVSPFISKFFNLDTNDGSIKPLYLAGALIMILGMLVSDPSVVEKVFKKKKEVKNANI